MRAPDDVALAEAVARGWAEGGRTGLFQARARVLKAAFDRNADSGYKFGEPPAVGAVKRCIAILQGSSQQALHPAYHHAAMSVGEITRARSRLCRTLRSNSRAPSRRLRGSPGSHSSEAPSAAVTPAFASRGMARMGQCAIEEA